MQYTTNNPYINNYISRHGVEKWLRKRYNLFFNMRKRVYSSNEREHYPTYKNCSICNEWLAGREAFNEWLEDAYYEIQGYEDSMELDKDCLHPGNRVYCPQYCVFVPHIINSNYKVDASRLSDAEYLKKKTDKIHKLAEEFREQIPKRLYNALMKFDINIPEGETA